MEYYDSDENKQRGSQSGSPNGKQQPKQPNSLATYSFMCSLAGFLLLCSCMAFPASIFLGVAAIVLAIMSRQGKRFTGMAIAGLILGILSLLFGILEFVYLMLINSMLRDPEMAAMFDQILEQYESMMPAR